MLAAAIAGCGKVSTDDTAGTTGSAVISVTAATETTETTVTTETTEPTKPRELYKFQSKVSSSFMEETFGKGMCDAWYSLVDAVLAGEDTFSCPNGHTYMWVIAEFPKVCFPVLGEIVDIDSSVELQNIDGTARFKYKVPKDEAARMISDFEVLVEDIMNEAMNPEYTDFENMLSLYIYFQDTYTYDYETADLIETEPAKANYMSSSRLLTQKTGVCSELSEAYAYLLLEAGIEASVVTAGKHEWSIVKLGDEYYHIDTTFALGSGGDLAYFMMTDDQRYETGYKKDNYEYVSIYSPEFPPDFPAGDDFFKTAWDGYLTSFDPENDKIMYDVYRNGQVVDRGVFDYGGMEQALIKKPLNT